MMKADLKRAKDDIDELEKAHAGLVNLYVTYKHFEAVVGRIQATQDDMQKDIKQILGYVSKN